jgi:hypothetical protein
VVSATASHLSPLPSANASTGADSTSQYLVTVTVNDACGHPVTAPPYNSQLVILTSSRGALDTVTLDPSYSNPTSTGQVAFIVKSMTPGTSTYTAVVKDTVTNATVNLADTAQVTFTDDCVLFGNQTVLSSSTLPIGVANTLFGSSRRLTDLTLTWPSPDSGGSDHVKLITSSLSGATLTIWNGNTNTHPLVVASGGWNSGTDAARTISSGATQNLQITFNFSVSGSGNFTLATTWDDGAGGHVCTKSYSRAP